MRDSDEEEKEELVAKCPTLRRIDYHNLQGHRTVTRYQHPHEVVYEASSFSSWRSQDREDKDEGEGEDEECSML